MGVALKTALGVTVGLVVTGQVPHDQGLVATGGEQHVGAMRPLLSETAPIPLYQKFEMQRAYFSSEVAKLVTQPLWPSRVPRRMSCSAMIKVAGR